MHLYQYRNVLTLLKMNLIYFNFNQLNSDIMNSILYMNKH